MESYDRLALSIVLFVESKLGGIIISQQQIYRWEKNLQ